MYVLADGFVGGVSSRELLDVIHVPMVVDVSHADVFGEGLVVSHASSSRVVRWLVHDGPGWLGHGLWRWGRGALPLRVG